MADESIMTATSSHAEAEQRARVDASVSRAVLLFFGNAMLWLFFGTLFGGLVVYKLKNPDHLSSILGYPLDFLNYGKIYPAFTHMWIYGWCFQASFGAVLWLLGRLTRAELKYSLIVQVSSVLWNAAVTLGVVCILAGFNTGYEWLEFPTLATVPMLLAFGIFAFGCVDMLRRRQPGDIYISLWYLIGAALWFPAIYFTGNLLLVWFPLEGIMGTLINVWVKQGIVGLWFVPVGLGLAYFLVPKVVGRPIYSYYLAAFGFWSLAFFSPWNAGAQLVGAPVPAWIITTGIATSFLMLIPVWVVGFNFHKTMEGNYSKAGSSPTLKFVVFGLIAYIFSQVLLALTAFRGVSQIAQSTIFSYGSFNLMFYAFFSFIMFGAVYYITPRMVGCEWISSRLIKWHFMLTAYAIIIVIMMWLVGGFIHGGAIDSTAVSAYFSGYKSVIESVNLLVRSPLPIMFLLWALMSVVLMIIGFSSKRLFFPMLASVITLWIMYTVFMIFDLLPKTSISVLVIPLWVLAGSQFLFIVHYLLMLFRLGRLTGGPTLLPEDGGGGAH
ncbi:MAG: cbb3-type cytochrome c oxidase subunit I [Verrucomicrobiota bacterium]